MLCVSRRLFDDFDLVIVVALLLVDAFQLPISSVFSLPAIYIVKSADG